MLHNVQDEFNKVTIHLQDLSLVQFNLAAALPIPGPSIVSADNNPNWEDTSAANPTTNTITVNRPTSSTCSWSKPRQSNNTNEQLANILSQLANTLNSN